MSLLVAIERTASRSCRKGEIREQILVIPERAAIRAIAPARRMFSFRSSSENPRSRQSSSRRPSPSMSKGFVPSLRSLEANPSAKVDLPEPESPVSQMIMKLKGSLLERLILLVSPYPYEKSCRSFRLLIVCEPR